MPNQKVSKDPKKITSSTYFPLTVSLVFVILISFISYRYSEQHNLKKFAQIESQLNDLSNRLKNQASQVRSLKSEGYTTTSINDSSIQELGRKVATVYGALSNSPQVFQAIYELKSAINHGSSFNNQLNKLTSLLPNLAKVADQLKPFSIKGVASPEKLSNRLTEISIKKAPIVDKDWKKSLIDRLSSVVEIHKINESPDIKIEHIKIHLLNHNLKSALEIAKDIKLAGMSQWQSDLQALILVHSIVQTIDMYVLRLMVEAEELKK